MYELFNVVLAWNEITSPEQTWLRKYISTAFGLQKKNSQSETGTSIQILILLASKLSCKLNILNQNQPKNNRKVIQFGKTNFPRLVWPVTVLWIPNRLESLFLYKLLAMASSRNFSLTILVALASASPCSLTYCLQAKLGSRSPKRPHNRLTRWWRIDFDNVWLLI